MIRYDKNKGCVFKFTYPYMIIGVMTGMIGYHIHDSVFWAIFDWFFYPIVWIKWLICHDVTMTIIRDTFSFFTK